MYVIKTKRVYEKFEEHDGYRLLVDRLWPRGLSKEKVAVDEWNREIGPSAELRKWFAHEPENFGRFTELYREELSQKQIELSRIREIAKQENLTLLYAAKDERINHAAILLDVLINLT